MNKILILSLLLGSFSCKLGNKNLKNNSTSNSNIYSFWKLEEIINDDNSFKNFEENEKIILKITRNNDETNYQIKASVNIYNGSVNIIDNKTIDIKEGMSTRAMSTNIEKLFTSQIIEKYEYIINENKLTLDNKDNNSKMIFSLYETPENEPNIIK